MPRNERAYWWGIVAATAALAMYLAAWIALTPPYRAPDEPLHLNSIVRVEFGGGWPAPGDARISDGIKSSLGEARFGATLPGRASEPRDDGFEDTSKPDAFTQLTAENSGLSGDNGDDQMTQHPPAFYMVAGGIFAVLGLPGESWYFHLLAARILTALLVLPVPMLVGATARLVTGSRAAGVLAALVPVSIPQFLHINSSASNDAAMTLMASLVTYLAVRAMVGRVSFRLTAALAAATGVALLTKGFGLALVPLVLAAIMVSPGLTFRGRAARVGLGTAITFATGGFWWVVNIVRYHTIQPAGRPPVWPVSRDPERGIEDFAYPAARRVAGSFWGRFGWLEIPLPEWLWIGLTLALVVAVGVGIVRLRSRLLIALGLFSVPIAVLGIFMTGSYGRFLEYGLMPGLQGRYLFAAIVSLAVLAVASVARLAAQTRPRAVVAAAWTLGGVALVAYGYIVAFRGFYVEKGTPLSNGWEPWVRWAPGGQGGAIAAVALAVLGLAAHAAAGWMAHRSEMSAEDAVEEVEAADVPEDVSR